MNRLRDEWGDDPVASRGIEILRGTPPTPRMPEMKRRVWLAQQQSVTPRAGGFRLSRLRVGVVVAGAILSIAGTSGAVIAARRWIVPALREITRPAPKVASRVAAAKSRTRAETAPSMRAGSVAKEEQELARADDSVIAGEASGQLVTPASVTARTPAATENSASAHASRLSHAGPARRRAMISGGLPAPASERAAPPEATSIVIPPTSTTATTAAAARERTQVLDAMIALRRDHDPVSAGAMLQHYLASHPSGTLREEALVLAIEAADARGDLALAKRLARQYQDAYPSGRFRRYAEDRAAPGHS
jgi:hypothetical protein